MNLQRIRLLGITLCLMMVLELVGGVPVGSIIQPPSAAAQSGPSCGSGLWDTTFFNDTNLTATAYIGCTSASQLNQGINWGTGSPVGGVGPNNYSARLITNLTFVTSGNYRFTATFQDSARLYINGQLTSINSWGSDVSTTQSASADYNVPAANTTVTLMLEFAKYTGTGEIKLAWQLTGDTGDDSTNGDISVGNPWTAEYFNNTSLTPPGIVGPSLPGGPLNLNWGLNAPLGGITPDNWSARFTSVVNFLQDGVITFEAEADDTVTVFVDDTPVTASAEVYIEGQVYRGSISLTAGPHTVRVEYRDFVAEAFLRVSWSGSGTDGQPAGPGVPASPTGVTGTVTASVLNVRQQPTVSATRITRIRKGETYAVLGQNTGGNWAYLDVNGTRGWASARWLQFSGNFNTLPLLDAAGNVIPDAGIMQARPVGNMRIRTCPAFNCPRVGYVPWGDIVTVYGQSADRRWIKVDYTDRAGNRISGWTYKIWYRVVDDLQQGLPANLPIVQ
ncbi:MAG: SH3 domain-containing protein [Chloroflexi bacterium]|nr:SH3 domain-containing protein [Chloroflexota bacterium]